MTENPYLNIVENKMSDSDSNLHQSLMTAVDKQPDVEARLQGLARQYDLPIDAVRLNSADVERRARLDSVPYGEIIRSLPATERLLRDPGKAAIAHDDVENLTGLEKALQFGKRSGSALLSGIYGFSEGVAGQMEAGTDLLRHYVTGPIADAGILPVDIGGPVQQAAHDIRKSQTDWRQFLMPKGGGAVESGYYSGLQSLTQNLLTFPLALATDNPALALHTMALNTGGQSYGKARDLGVSPERSVIYGGADAAIEYATEKTPFGLLFKDLKAGTPFFKALATQIAKEIPNEQAATILQDLNEWSVLHPEKTMKDFLAERPDAALQTLVATAVGAGGQVSLLHGVQALADRNQQRHDSAHSAAANLEQINQLMAASKVLGRSPDAMRDFVGDAVKGNGAENLYIDAKAFMQTGVAEQIAAAVPAIAEQLPAALASGGEIRIPLADYVTQIAPTSFAQKLTDHIRVEGEEFSRAGATAYMAEHGDALRHEMEAVLRRRANDEAWQGSTDSVKSAIYQQLDALGKHPTQVNEQYATLMGSYFATMAERLGVTPDEFYQSSRLNFANLGAGGNGLNQFAGAGAATADLHQLDAAESRLAAGEDAEKVRQETGWNKGVDGRWRFEISDSGAALKPLNEGAKEGVLLKSNTLENLIDHPALFAAYPQLKDLLTNITIDPELKAGTGRFELGTDGDQIEVGREPEITVSAPTKHEALSVLLHEIQHAIQNHEGFASGGSPQHTGMIGPVNKLKAEDLKRKLTVIQNESQSEAKQLIRQSGENQEIADFVQHAFTKWAAQFGEYSDANPYGVDQEKTVEHELLDQNHSYQRLAQQYNDALKLGGLSPVEVYQRLAGEVEARNTEARAGLRDAERGAIPPEQTQDIKNSDVIVTFNGREMQSASEPANALGRNAVTGDLERVNQPVRDAVLARLERFSEADRERVKANLEKFKGTSWAAAAVKGMAYREMLERAMAGEDISALENNPIWGKQDMSATKIIKAFKKVPEHQDKVLQALLSSYDFIGDNRKAENDISTSFANCEPSMACAVYCYAAGSNARPVEIAKSELTEFMLEHFPAEMAEKIAGDYMATMAGKAGLSLRLNDKGDLSPAQVQLVKNLNERGIFVQVFSRRPELLRTLSDVNLKILSVDSTNMELAAANPDLRLAVTITDDLTEAMLTPLHDRVSVYLPVNLKGKSVGADEMLARFPELYPKMRKENLCPVDGSRLDTKPGTSFVSIQNGTADKGVWTCTACDLTGSVGCFHGDRQTSQRKAAAMINSDFLRDLELKRVRKGLQSNLDTLLALGGIDGKLHKELSEALLSGERAVREFAGSNGERRGLEKTGGTPETGLRGRSDAGQSVGGQGNAELNSTDDTPESGAFFQRRKGDDKTQDLFGYDVPDTAGSDRKPIKRTRGGISRDDVPRGNYATKTQIVSETTRELGTDKVTTATEAAQAMAYLSRSAVERLDALVTDAKGRPLAIVGAFKGSLAHASVYPATIAAEAFRIKNAANIWFAHNHPSGSAKLSGADRGISAKLAEVFRGSEIQARGILAIGGQDGGGRRWVYEAESGAGDEFGTTTEPVKRKSVPILERVYSEEGKLSQPLTSADLVKDLASTISGGESGVILTDNQHAPVAFVPLQSAESEQLRTGGRMDSLHRALSMANAGAAIILNHGDMSFDAVDNLAGFFNSNEVRMLDVLDWKRGAFESRYEAGLGGDFSGHTFRQSGSDILGQYFPDTRTIALLDKANLSTFLHESGHFFLDMHFEVGQRLQASSLAGESLTPLQQQLVDDVQTLVEWFGLESISDWYNLSFEQQRTAHEKFALGFEKYLWTGKAPSTSLARLFANFRAWMTDVYKRLKNHWQSISLSPEVRSVMDRMLASDLEIEQAVQARAMMPLFEDMASSGLTPEEWAAYQTDGAEAERAAKEKYALAGLADMQWLSGARNKELKRLQREHDELRREIRAEVRLQVMARPIYRVWDFLTRPLGKDDKLKVPAFIQTMNDKHVVNPEVDSLFAAISKFGGLDRQQLESEWNWDAGAGPFVLFGKPLVRKTNGMPISEMIEHLRDAGYLSAADGDYEHELEQKFSDELRGIKQYSTHYNPPPESVFDDDMMPGEQVINPFGLNAGRIDFESLKNMTDLPVPAFERIFQLGMTGRVGIHPSLLSDWYGFDSGEDLVLQLAAAPKPREEIETLTNVAMLQRYGHLATPEARRQAADAAIHNEARARFLATEEKALAEATGSQQVMSKAAREFAERIIGRLKIQDVRPYQYELAEKRAAKAALKARTKGSLPEAAAAKRAEVFNFHAAAEAWRAIEDRDAGLRYFAKFKKAEIIKNIGADYNDQIFAVLGMFGLLRPTGGRVESLSAWLAKQAADYKTPFIPGWLRDIQTPMDWRELTVEQFRDLVDTVQQIEFLGRHERKLLVMAKQTEFAELDSRVAASIVDNAGEHLADIETLRTANDDMGKLRQTAGQFFYGMIRARTVAHILDGGKSLGEFFNTFIRTADERGNYEALKRAEYAKKLMAIWAPIYKLGRMNKRAFPVGDGRKLTREQVIGIALNWGNSGNQQRLMDGEGWNERQIHGFLAALTVDEMLAVQTTWDLFEQFKPQTSAQSRAMYGKSMEYVHAQPFQITLRNGDGQLQNLSLRGGYYPVRYDTRGSAKASQLDAVSAAQEMLQGARGAPVTRHSYDKSRAKKVVNRPILLSMDGMWQGMNEVIHDLSWRMWLADFIQFLRPESETAKAILDRYGPDYIYVLKKWGEAIAGGDSQMPDGYEKAVNAIRRNIGLSSLAFNFMSAAMQPLGLGQSYVEIGGEWLLKGLKSFSSHPKKTAEFVRGKSDLMKHRALTRFKEIAEVKNAMGYTSERMQKIHNLGFAMISNMQLAVDYPTWLGAYLKHLAAGADDAAAVAAADNAVLASQGGGQTKDLSAMENSKNPAFRLFTLFFNFMGTRLNQLYAAGQSREFMAALAAIGTLEVLLPIFEQLIRHSLQPSAGGDDDDWALHMNRWPQWLLENFLGQFLFIREFIEPVKSWVGMDARDYAGPTGLKMIPDAIRAGHQLQQGDVDRALIKAIITFAGDFGYAPGATQINKTISGVEALGDEETSSPLAIGFGVRR